MENDVLKNKIAPWQEKGRWYHGKIDVATNTLIPEYTDDLLLDTSIFTLSAALPRYYLVSSNINYRIIDAVYIPDKDYRRAANENVNYATTQAQATGIINPPIGITGTAGKIDFWVFIII